MTNVCRSIVFFDQYRYVGGGQTVLLSLLDVAVPSFERVLLVIPTGGALEEAVSQRFGTAVEIRPSPEPRLTFGKKSLGDVARLILYTLRMCATHWRLARGASLLYANGARQFPAVMLLSVLARRPACYHVHIDHRSAAKWLVRLAAHLSVTARIVINSPYVHRRLIHGECVARREPKITVIENALSRSFSGLPFRNRFAGRSQPWNVVVLGVLRPEKGQDEAIELARRTPWIQLHLIGRIGEGAESWVNELKSKAPANVTFHAATAHVPRAVDAVAGHINLVPSRWDEPFGLVAIEGMACSCITIVRASGALPDIAARTGAIVYQGGLDQLTAEFKRLRGLDPTELSDLARSQHAATIAVYGESRFSVEMQKLLQAAARFEKQR